MCRHQSWNIFVLIFHNIFQVKTTVTVITVKAKNAGPADQTNEAPQGHAEQQTAAPKPPKQKKERKPKKNLRYAGGTVWEDSTLSEWDPGECTVLLFYPFSFLFFISFIPTLFYFYLFYPFSFLFLSLLSLLFFIFISFIPSLFYFYLFYPKLGNVGGRYRHRLRVLIYNCDCASTSWNDACFFTYKTL